MRTFSNVNLTLEDGAENNRPILSGQITIGTDAVNNATVTGTVNVAGGTNASTATVTGTVNISAGTNAAPVIGGLSMSGGTNASTAVVTGNATLNGGTNNAPVSSNLTVAGGTNASTAAVGGVLTLTSGSNAAPVAGGAVISGGTNASTAAISGSLILSGTGTNNAPVLGNAPTFDPNRVDQSQSGGNDNGYKTGDRVFYNGKNYQALANNDAILPTNTTYWKETSGPLTGNVTINGGTNASTATVAGNLVLNGGSNAAPVTGNATIAGGTNASTAVVSGNLVLSGTGTNNAPVTGDATITGGTNTAAISGSAVISGGTNASTATISGNVTITGGLNQGPVLGAALVSGGTNAAAVTGSVVVSGNGVQSGNVNGNITLEGSGSIAAGTVVTGNLIVASNTAAPAGNITVSGGIVLAAGVSASAVLAKVPSFTGNVVAKVGETLTTTAYTGGTAGSSTNATGVYYNLEGDSKAYNYSGASKTAITGNYFNLTGDNRAYTWTSGVKGALFTGTIDGVSYTNGVAAAPSGNYAEFNVSDGPVGNKLYSAIGGGVGSSVLYTNTLLTTPYTGSFTYNSVSYYADETGNAYTYRGWAVTDDTNSNVLYTSPTGTLLTSTIYTGDGLTGAGYTGVFTYGGATYYSEAGTANAYRKFVVTGDTNNGELYANPLFNGGAGELLYTDSARTQTYIGLYKYTEQFYAATNTGVLGFEGIGLHTDGKYYNIVEGVMTIDPSNYGTDIGMLFNDKKYYLFDGSGNLGALLNDPIQIGELLYGVLNGELSGLYNGVALTLDNEYFYYTEGVKGAGFNGAYLAANGNYTTVTNGVLGNSSVDLANGIMLFVGDLKYYIFDNVNSPAAKAAFNGALEFGGSYYSVVDGLKETTASFNGAYLGSDNYYYSVNNGDPIGGGFASGVRMLASNGLYYNFPNNGTIPSTAFSGAIRFGESFYSVSNGSRESTPTFTGVYIEANGWYYNSDNGATTSNLASGVRKFSGDGLYYEYPGTGGAGTLFDGAYFRTDLNTYVNVDAGVVTATGAEGARKLLSDGVYYAFSSGNKSTYTYTGPVKVGDYWYHVILGSREPSPTFNGVYDRSGSLARIQDGAETSSGDTSGVLLYVSDNKYYNQDNSANRTLFTGAVDFYNDNWFSVNAGVRENEPTFTGAALYNGSYISINDGHSYNQGLASGLRVNASNGLYYNFNNGQISADPFTGVLTIGDYFYNVTSGVKEAQPTWSGAVLYESYYFNVNSGARSGDYAAGVRQSANDQLYYNYTGNGSQPSPLDGNYLYNSLYSTFIGGVVVGNFTGAYLGSDNNYYNVDNGNPVGGGFASGVRMLASDGLYYNFPNNGTKPSTGFNGAVKIGDNFYIVSSGSRETTATFTGAFYDATYNRYDYITNGYLYENAVPNGYHRDGSDAKLYRFSSGQRQEALNGGVNLGSGYMSVEEGEVKNYFASGIGIIINGTNAGKYGIFSSGIATLAEYGGTTAESKWYHVLGGELSPSFFTGAVPQGNHWYDIHPATGQANLSAAGDYMLPDGRMATFSGGTISSTPISYETYLVNCDDNPLTATRRVLYVFSTNMGGRVYTVGTQVGETRYREVTTPYNGTFVSAGIKYTVGSGTITELAACSPDYTD